MQGRWMGLKTRCMKTLTHGRCIYLDRFLSLPLLTFIPKSSLQFTRNKEKGIHPFCADLLHHTAFRLLSLVLELPSPYLSTREASLKEMQTKSVTQTQSDLISCWQNFLSSLLAANMFLPSNNVITDAVPSFLAATWWSPTWLRASASETRSSCLCRFMCMWPACIARGTRGAEEACHLWLPILSRC